MIYYKLIEITINTLSLVDIISNIVIQYYKILDLIIINKNLFFILNYGYCFIIFSKLSGNFVLPFICKKTVKKNNKTVL